MHLDESKCMRFHIKRIQLELDASKCMRFHIKRIQLDAFLTRFWTLDAFR